MDDVTGNIDLGSFPTEDLNKLKLDAKKQALEALRNQHEAITSHPDFLGTDKLDDAYKSSKFRLNELNSQVQDLESSIPKKTIPPRPEFLEASPSVPKRPPPINEFNMPQGRSVYKDLDLLRAELNSPKANALRMLGKAGRFAGKVAGPASLAYEALRPEEANAGSDVPVGPLLTPEQMQATAPKNRFPNLKKQLNPDEEQ